MRWGFAASMAVGVMLVVFGLQSAKDAKRPADALAIVDGVPIRAVELLGRDRSLRRGVDDAAAKRALEAAITEEVLFQRALARRLHRTDGVIRARMIQGMQDIAVGDATFDEPTEAELREYHAAHRGAFPGPDRFRLEEIFLPRDGADDRNRDAHAARARLKAEPWQTVRADHPDPPSLRLDTGMHRADRIRHWYGHSFLRAVTTLKVGEISPPLQTRLGSHLIRLVAREPGPALDFERARVAVRSRYVRARERAEYADYVAAALREADIWVAPDVAERLRAAARPPPAEAQRDGRPPAGDDRQP